MCKPVAQGWFGHQNLTWMHVSMLCYFSTPSHSYELHRFWWTIQIFECMKRESIFCLFAYLKSMEFISLVVYWRKNLNVDGYLSIFLFVSVVTTILSLYIWKFPRGGFEPFIVVLPLCCWVEFVQITLWRMGVLCILYMVLRLNVLGLSSRLLGWLIWSVFGLWFS